MLIPLSYEGTGIDTREGVLAAHAAVPPIQRASAQAMLVNNFFIESI